MRQKKLSNSDYDIFFKKTLIWVFFAAIGLALSLLGFFNAWIAFGATFAIGIWFAYRAIENDIFGKISREFVMIGILITIFVFILSCFTTPSVFSGRDQGALSEAAIRLAQNGSFEFSTQASDAFHEINSERFSSFKSLNFPGFYFSPEGKLTTQFPLPYIVWLALFYGIFNTIGLVIANSVLMIFSLLAIYLLARKFMPMTWSLILLLFMTTSFTFTWFFKFTLSENLAFTLLWTSILGLVSFHLKPRKLYYFSFLASSLLLILTRIEGFAFFVLSFLVIALSSKTRLFIKSNLKQTIVFPAIAFIIILAGQIFVDRYFYREIAKVLFNSLSQTNGGSPDEILSNFYQANILFLYGLLGFFITGIAGILYFIKEKKFSLLIPFFVTVPAFLYLLNAHISNDHPWMLRRFMFAVLPACMFFSALLFSHLWQRKSSSSAKFAIAFLTALLILMNMPAFSKYIFFSENRTLLKQVRLLSKNFNSRDLILVDQQASGDGWSMIAGPMSSIYKKNAVYFFNPSDLEKLDLEQFDTVYLITPDSRIPFYMQSIGDRLGNAKEYTLSAPRLASSDQNIATLPKKEFEVVNGKIFVIKK